MNILIDTHIFLWALSDPTQIVERKRIELETAINTIYVSSITVAEIMIKASIGKLKFDFDPLMLVKESGFEHLDFTSQDATLLKELPFHHKDPFDRMLICQSLTNKFPLMTEDKKIIQYNCQVI